MPDWEESLYGTDPNKKDTNGDGITDGTEIAKRKTIESADDEKLTETEKFSRELFSTVAALNQTGAMDQAAVEKISASLADKIQNPKVRKTYLISDLKTTPNDSLKSFQTYSSSLNKINGSHSKKNTVLSVLQKFLADENNPDESVLVELDPIIKESSDIKNSLIGTTVPESIAVLHLALINTLEKLIENISDIRLYDKDVILSLGAIAQYEENTNALNSATKNLGAAINKKLSN